MRMWKVPPHLMCQKHLLGEHTEMHMFVGSLAAGKSVEGFVRDGLVDTLDIKARHDELVVEMVARGMVHRTPIEINPVVRPAISVDLHRNVRELMRRCPDCRARLETEFGVDDTIPKGGDRVWLSDEGWSCQLSGMFAGGPFKTRDKAVTTLEKLRREMRR